MQLGEKLKFIRLAENLKQNEFCALTAVSISSVKKYETGINAPGTETLMAVANHPRFQKYTLWLMSGATVPEAGQVSPAERIPEENAIRLTDKIRTIRIAENLSQAQFCALIKFPFSTLKKYESGRFQPGGDALVKIATHPRFYKYTLWLMTGTTAPEVGQIAPPAAKVNNQSNL